MPHRTHRLSLAIAPASRITSAISSSCAALAHRCSSQRSFAAAHSSSEVCGVSMASSLFANQ